MAFLRRIWNRDDGRRARRLHGARHRHGVRQGARVRDRRDRPRASSAASAASARASATCSRARSRTSRRVVDNCAVALQEAEEMAGLPAQPGRHRHRGRAREGLHDDAHPGAQAARAADHRRGARRSSSTPSSARRSRRPSGRSPGRPACRSVDVRLVHARSSAPRSTATGSRTRSASRAATSRSAIFNAFAPLVHLGALQSRREPAGPRAARDRRRAVRRGARPRTGAGPPGRARCSSTWAVARRTSRSSARAASRGRGCSRSAAARSRSRSRTASTCRSRAPRQLKVDYARGLDFPERATRSRRSWATTSRSGPRASSS